MNERNPKGRKCLSTTKILLLILVVGTTMSSLLLVSFHFKSHSLLTEIASERRFQFIHRGRQDNYAKRPKPMQTTNATVLRPNHQSNESLREGCLPKINSMSWLNARRLGNQNRNDSMRIDQEYVTSSIRSLEHLFSNDEASIQTILGRSLCAKSSRFQTYKFSMFSNGTSEEINEIQSHTPKNIRQLSLRLLYLSIHVHQHRHAISEAQHRWKDPNRCQQDMETYSVGDYDFECPNAKFLVVPMKHGGLGAQTRLVAAPALMAGIASDRVVIFVNGAPLGPSFLREPWDLSSCPRRDKQCFFLPDTPCVLTLEEIQNATNLSKGERRGLYKTGTLPEHLQDERVVVMNTISRPQRTPLNFRPRVTEIAKELIIGPLEKDHPNDLRLPILHAAADHLLVEDGDFGDSFSYYGRNFQAHHAMVVYATRPRLEYADRIDRILDETFDASHRTDRALGLPIRASDKCIAESECPSFETYMELVQNLWETHIIHSNFSKVDDGLDTNIIVTSESLEILNAQETFQERLSKTTATNENRAEKFFPHRFVTNRPFDVFPNSGDPRALASHESSMEEILLASMASLKMQFYAKYTSGNCCSNHHLLLFDFLEEGCGADDLDHSAVCMQDHEMEKFRICCGWTKTEKCLATRSKREALERMSQNTSQTTS